MILQQIFNNDDMFKNRKIFYHKKMRPVQTSAWGAYSLVLLYIGGELKLSKKIILKLYLHKTKIVVAYMGINLIFNCIIYFQILGIAWNNFISLHIMALLLKSAKKHLF